MRRVFLSVIAMFVPLAAYPATVSYLSPDGLGPLRIGMTEAAAERALGEKLGLSGDASGDAEACEEGEVPGKPGVYVLTEHHRVMRIVLDAKAEGIGTAEGVRIGTTESQLRKIFGKRAVFKPRPYEEDVRGAQEVIVKVSAHRAFVFETENYKVQEIRAGDIRAVQYMEGCA